jgi:hypothetical protein
MKFIISFCFIFLFSLVLFDCSQKESSPVASEEANNLFKGKPDKNPKSEKSELITFEGDFDGSQEVVNCCPNAGPFPEYTMTLSGPFPPEMSGREISGNIFMNRFGRNLPWAYKVQFWWTENNKEIFLEVRGGVIQKDRRNKITTVTFTRDTCEIWIDNALTEKVLVDFTLTRTE